MAELTLHEHEQRAILGSPRSIMLLMYWHDYQQDCADSMGAECHGNRDRYEQLKAHGRAIIETEGVDAFDDEVLRAFDFPVSTARTQARQVCEAYPASGAAAADRCQHGVRYPHPCRECEDAPLPHSVPGTGGNDGN